jgi:hypothetical protein
MTMRIYTKIQTAMKRQALAKLSYGQGTPAPTNVLDYPAVAGTVESQHRKLGHNLVTSSKTASCVST